MWRAFRANIIKQTLAVVLLAFAINFACATSASAQMSKEIQRAEKVGREINKIGIGEKVWVKTLGGTKLKGHINEIGDDYVVMADNKTGNVTRLRFTQVKQVKGNNLTKGAERVAAVAGALAAVFVILFFVQRTER